MKTLEIIPVENFNTTVKVPGSKSYTMRAFLISALGEGKSVLKNLLLSDDTKYMAEGLRAFGINIIQVENTFTVYGTGGKLTLPAGEIYPGNSGAATRFLTGFASLCPGRTIITGDQRMKERPLEELLKGLEQLKVKVNSSTGCPPVEIEGGTLSGGTCRMKGHISSQFFSSLILIAPYAKNDITIEVEGELTSKSYIDITLDIMKYFGVKVENRNYKEFFIKSGQPYKAAEYTIESDASSSSYFLGGAAITKGRIIVKNVNPGSVQGDIHFVDVLEKMGCKVIRRENEMELTGNELKGIEIDMNKMPDTVQTLAVVACFAKGETVIKNISNLRIKETDRIKAITTELKKTGTEVTELKDGLIIKPGVLKGAEIETYNDHRMAMSFALMGLKVPGIKIKNPDCVSKSFPEFWNILKGTGVNYLRINS